MRSLIACGAVCVLLGAQAADRISLEGEYAGHLQDVWMTSDTIWWAHTECLVRTDRNGKIIRRAEVGGHHAGLEVKDGRLYTAVCAFNGEPRGSTTPKCHVMVGEYDAETLERIEMHVLDINDRAGSFCFLEDGTFLVGCLRHPSLKPSEVKFHHIGKDWKLIGTHVVDVGKPVPLGIEVIRRYGNDLYLFIYGGPVMRLDARTFETTGELMSVGGQTGFAKEGDSVWVGTTSRPKDAKTYRSGLRRIPWTKFSPADPDARPYEFAWANRTADEFPPVCRLASADGWTAEGSNAEAKVSTTDAHILFDDTSLRLDYRATGRDPTVRLRPSRPVKVPDGFDTATLWVYGNNIWGKVGGGNTNAVPSLKIVAEFAGADGKPFELSLGSEKHRGWFLMTGVVTDGARQVAAPSGLRFTGFRIRGGTNRDFNSICLTSFAVFADPKRPLDLKPRPQRGVRLFPDAPQGLNVGEGKLPFPNTPRTVLPPSRTLPGKLEFRLPKDPLVWDDLAFRYEGSDWVRLAVGGGLFPKGGVAGAKVTFHRDGNSLVCDIVRPEPGVESVRFGAMDLPKGGVSTGWPFYTGRYASWWDCPAIPEELSGRIRPKTAVFKLGGRRLVVAATFDWTQSNASSPIGWKGDPDGQVRLNGGVMYLPKTDGVRNGCFERFVWTFGEKVEDVLPTIPNPPSPYRRETSAGSWTSCHAANREADAAYWRAVKKAGLSHVIITDHESGWRDGDESFTLRTRTAPKKGGDASQLRYARILIDELGFRYGPYNNFTDYAPVNAHWSLDYASRYPDGSLGDAWYRCYKPKPTWAVGMCEKLTPQIQGKFGFNTAYCDVHTCVTPWNRTDYDVRSPGAATFAQTFYAYGEIMLIQKANWKGPVYSEGCIQWLYSGLTDGNYGQDEEYDFGAEPWLVDFDLRRIHPLENTFGIGAPYMFYRRTNGKLVKPETDLWADRFTAATLAFGHAGYFYSKRKPDDLTWERKFYYPVQAIAARYGVADAVEIRYGAADGRLLATEDALVRGAVTRNQVRVTYSDGTVVAANGSMTETFPVSVQGEDVVLPPNGWYARTKDGEIVTYCMERGGKRVHYAKSPEYEERW